jgi:CheY-like chemotaxis protein
MPDNRHVLTLVANRDGALRHECAEFLRSCGCDVDEAIDGRDALAKAFARHPDVLITSARLGGISGLELCELLRADPVTSDIRIVCIAGDGSESDIARATAAGADAVLPAAAPEIVGAALSRLLTKSVELRARSDEARAHSAEQLARASALVERSVALGRRVMLSRAHRRGVTLDPSVRPPALVCPSCDRPLRYLKSHLGGVSERHPEQWDYLECESGCGTFQYRQRTRKLRKV